MKSDLIYDLTSSSFAAICGVILTNPLDVIKTRYQINKSPNIGIMRTMYTTIKHGSILSLWSGLTPALLRAITYGGLRLGLYPILRDRSYNYLNNLTASLVSGAFAALVTNPIELIKVHIQTSRNNISILNHMKLLYSNIGLLGFWNGTIPAMQRSALLTAGQIGCYDSIKNYISNNYNIKNKSLLAISSAWVAGIITTTITSPFDVLKVRRMKEGRSISLISLLKSEGFRVLFKGWWPNYVRVGPQTFVVLTVLEYLQIYKQKLLLK